MLEYFVLDIWVQSITDHFKPFLKPTLLRCHEPILFWQPLQELINHEVHAKPQPLLLFEADLLTHELRCFLIIHAIIVIIIHVNSGIQLQIPPIGPPYLLLLEDVEIGTKELRAFGIALVTCFQLYIFPYIPAATCGLVRWLPVLLILL